MAVITDSIRSLLPEFREQPARSFSMSYDAEGDVLYINFEKGLAADDSDEITDDVIARYFEGRVIGYTVLNASLHGVGA